jgi:hypothetical protein
MSSDLRHHEIRWNVKNCDSTGRDRVMEPCCALHNFRMRLPWQPMV